MNSLVIEPTTTWNRSISVLIEEWSRLTGCASLTSRQDSGSAFKQKRSHFLETGRSKVEDSIDE